MDQNHVEIGLKGIKMERNNFLFKLAFFEKIRLFSWTFLCTSGSTGAKVREFHVLLFSLVTEFWKHWNWRKLALFKAARLNCAKVGCCRDKKCGGYQEDLLSPRLDTRRDQHWRCGIESSFRLFENTRNHSSQSNQGRGIESPPWNH